MRQAKEEAVYSEIWNDALWLSYLIEIKKKLKDYDKVPIERILEFICPIFCYEVLDAEEGVLSGKRKISINEMAELRQYNLKNVPKVESEKTRAIVNDMGINFNNFMFDIVMYMKNDELIDFNYNWWRYNDEKYFEVLDGAACTPMRWIERHFSVGKIVIEQLANVFEEKGFLQDIEIKPKSYSCYKLFSNRNLDDEGKLYILKNFGLIKSLFVIEKFFVLPISISDGIGSFDSNRFLIKLKAEVIEKIWTNYNENHITVLKKVFEINQRTINKDFYSINRKCRNNLHYKKYSNLTKEEYSILNKYQNIYLKNVLDAFENEISYKFDWKYKMFLYLANLAYNRKEDII